MTGRLPLALAVTGCALAWWLLERLLPDLTALDAPTSGERGWWVRLNATAARHQITNHSKENRT